MEGVRTTRSRATAALVTNEAVPSSALRKPTSRTIKPAGAAEDSTPSGGAHSIEASVTSSKGRVKTSSLTTSEAVGDVDSKSLPDSGSPDAELPDTAAPGRTSRLKPPSGVRLSTAGSSGTVAEAAKLGRSSAISAKPPTVGPASAPVSTSTTARTRLTGGVATAVPRLSTGGRTSTAAVTTSASTPRSTTSLEDDDITALKEAHKIEIQEIEERHRGIIEDIRKKQVEDYAGFKQLQERLQAELSDARAIEVALQARVQELLLLSTQQGGSSAGVDAVVADLQAKVRTSLQEKDEHARRNNELSARVKQLQSELSDIAVKHEEEKQRLNKQLTDANTQAEDLRSEVAALKEEMLQSSNTAEVVAELEALRLEKESLTLDKETLELEKEEAQSNVAELQNMLKAHEAALQVKDLELERVKEERDVLQRSVMPATTPTKKQENAGADGSPAVFSPEKGITMLQDNNSKLRTALAALQARMQELEAECNTAHQTTSLLQSERDSLSAKVSELQAEYEIENRNLFDAREQIQNLQAQLDESSSQTLVALVEKLTMQNEGLVEEVERLKQQLEERETKLLDYEAMHELDEQMEAQHAEYEAQLREEINALQASKVQVEEKLVLAQKDVVRLTTLLESPEYSTHKAVDTTVAHSSRLLRHTLDTVSSSSVARITAFAGLWPSSVLTIAYPSPSISSPSSSEIRVQVSGSRILLPPSCQKQEGCIVVDVMQLLASIETFCLRKLQANVNFPDLSHLKVQSVDEVFQHACRVSLTDVRCSTNEGGAVHALFLSAELRNLLQQPTTPEIRKQAIQHICEKSAVLNSALQSMWQSVTSEGDVNLVDFSGDAGIVTTVITDLKHVLGAGKTDTTDPLQHLSELSTPIMDGKLLEKLGVPSLAVATLLHSPSSASADPAAMAACIVAEMIPRISEEASATCSRATYAATVSAARFHLQRVAAMIFTIMKQLSTSIINHYSDKLVASSDNPRSVQDIMEKELKADLEALKPSMQTLLQAYGRTVDAFTSWPADLSLINSDATVFHAVEVASVKLHAVYLQLQGILQRVQGAASGAAHTDTVRLTEVYHAIDDCCASLQQCTSRVVGEKTPIGDDVIQETLSVVMPRNPSSRSRFVYSCQSLPVDSVIHAAVSKTQQALSKGLEEGALMDMIKQKLVESTGKLAAKDRELHDYKSQVTALQQKMVVLQGAKTSARVSEVVEAKDVEPAALRSSAHSLQSQAHALAERYRHALSVAHAQKAVSILRLEQPREFSEEALQNSGEKASISDSPAPSSTSQLHKMICSRRVPSLTH